jgi:hypothetical protein
MIGVVIVICYILAGLVRMDLKFGDDGLARELLFGTKKRFGLSSSRIVGTRAARYCNGHAISAGECAIATFLGHRARPGVVDEAWQPWRLL